MRPPVRVLPNFRSSGGFSTRCFASASYSTTRAIPFSNIERHVYNNLYLKSSHPRSHSYLYTTPLFLQNHLSDRISRSAFSTTPNAHAISFRDLKSDQKSQESPQKSTQRTAEKATEGASAAEEEDPAERAYREAQKESETYRRESRKQEEKQKARDSEKEEAGEKDSGGQKKKEDPPPPPPHGNKSPWQVFTETLKTEFQASKEWNDSTKQLASSAHQFTENESVKRARAAYTAASGAATSSTASALKGTGKAIGQGAAWTWDSAVVKGVRTGVNVTASGIDKVTKPVRDTKVYKTAVGGVKDVIDDGSSSKYGGWVEKEERRKQRELRDLNESGIPGRPGKRPEKIEEDPK